MRGDGHELQEGRFSWGERRRFLTKWSKAGGRTWGSFALSSVLIFTTGLYNPLDSDSKSSSEVTFNLIYSAILRDDSR